MKATPPKGMAYLLGIVKRQLREAADIGASPGMPTAAWDEIIPGGPELAQRAIGAGESVEAFQRSFIRHLSTKPVATADIRGNIAPAGDRYSLPHPGICRSGQVRALVRL